LIPVILVVLCCPRWCSSCEFRAPFLSSVSSVLAQTGDVTPVSCTEWKERLAQARWRQIVALDLVTSLYFFCLHYLASEYSLCKSERRSIDKIVCSEYSEQHSLIKMRSETNAQTDIYDTRFVKGLRKSPCKTCSDEPWPQPTAANHSLA
jgi:hypothetical protein